MSLIQQIQQFEQQKIAELTSSYQQKGFEASGNWSKELLWVNTITPFRINLKLLGASYTQFMMHGRAPTSNNAATNDPNLLETITQWIKDKHLDLNPYAVTKTIHAKGTKQYRNPDSKKKALLSDVFTKNETDKLIDIIRKDQIQQIVVNMKKTFT